MYKLNALTGKFDLVDAPYKLSTDAETLLSITGKTIGLDTQAANTVFAGRVDAGAAQVPTFRTLDEADIPAVVAGEIHAADAASLADADEMGFWQATSSLLKKITWANIKTALDGLYLKLTGGTITGNLHVDGTLTNYNSALMDMGVEQESDARGYGLDYITDKRLSNVLIGSNARNENGAIKVDVTKAPDTLEIYLRGLWNTIIYDMTTVNGDFRHTPLDEQIYIWRGDSVELDASGQLPTIQEYQTSMGAFQRPRVIDGGSF